MQENYKNISILGSTGSIGTQSLEVIQEIYSDYTLKYISANNNIELLEQQANIFKPENVVISNFEKYKEFKANTTYQGNVLFGEEGLLQAASDTDNDIIISALVGFSGVMPAYSAIEAGNNIALANKESLVAAGKILKEKSQLNNSKIIAVDSEHSAVLQCLSGEEISEIEKIILTASGGPFIDYTESQMLEITVEKALKHPNWSMGNKITIDSATMMNKGFEIIEAYWLFDIDPKKIDVLVHKQSIIHSMIQFQDGSVKAQLGLPDMKIPISYSLTYPKRAKLNIPRMDLSILPDLTFSKPDSVKFPCLNFAYKTLELGGNSGAIINGANETAVYAFLDKQIKYQDIPVIIEKSLEKIAFIQEPSIEDIINTDKEVRAYATSIIKENYFK